MADIQEKNPSVELDTDGVNDQTIEVETPTESTTEFEKKEDEWSKSIDLFFEKFMKE